MDEANGSQGIETQAREMGWVPREEFRGSEDRWVDAATFVEKGEHVLPIVKATNKRLQNEIDALKRRLEAAEQTNASAQDTLKALNEHQEAMAKQQYERALESLKAKKKDAIREADADAVVEIDEAIQTLREKQAAPAKPTEPAKPEAPATTDIGTQPWFKAWQKENDWFGKDLRRSGYALGIAQEYQSKGVTGPALLEKMREEVDAHFGPVGGEGASKVEGSRGGAGTPSGSRGGKKSYADLPAEARAYCDKMEARLVGPGRLHKDRAAWRDSYTKQYFAGEE